MDFFGGYGCSEKLGIMRVIPYEKILHAKDFYAHNLNHPNSFPQAVYSSGPQTSGGSAEAGASAGIEGVYRSDVCTTAGSQEGADIMGGNVGVGAVVSE